MIVSKALVSGFCRKPVSFVNVVKIPVANIYNRSLIGNRDWVGFGRTGCATYFDDITYPFPAVRFRENSNELLALREKEKGDWRKLTMDEKKTLYRASFRQTLVEVMAPTGQWKSVLGATLFLFSLGVWIYIVVKCFVVPPLPPSFSEENRREILRLMLVNKWGHLNGISSKWDYELDDWKK